MYVTAAEYQQIKNEIKAELLQELSISRPAIKAYLYPTWTEVSKLISNQLDTLPIEGYKQANIKTAINAIIRTTFDLTIVAKLKAEDAGIAKDIATTIIAMIREAITRR